MPVNGLEPCIKDSHAIFITGNSLIAIIFIAIEREPAQLQITRVFIKIIRFAIDRFKAFMPGTLGRHVSAALKYPFLIENVIKARAIPALIQPD